MAPYRVLYHPDVPRKDLPFIPENIKTRIKTAIENRLIPDPALAGKPLRQSLKGHRKLRVGDWRVIYRVQDDAIVVLIIGNRKDIYKDVFRRI